jgi:opacity protein-like surface antigen
MKPILLLPIVLALPAFAGTPAKQTIAPPPPPCLTSWFAGASVGYLTELEEPMYNLHVGTTNSCWVLGGWNVSLFGEIGYTQKDEDYAAVRGSDNYPRPIQQSSYTVSEMEDALAGLVGYYGGAAGYELQVMPITLNVKFARPLTDKLSAYIGAGLGAAWVDLELSASNIAGDSVKLSDSAWVFTSQVFAGLDYSVTPNFDVYGGARWIYYSDASLSDLGESADLKLGSDCLLELGARYKF